MGTQYVYSFRQRQSVLTTEPVLFTGSGRVGRIIASAAGKTLTPVTLEASKKSLSRVLTTYFQQLGGKSPVFVDPKCDLPMTTRRIFWGKIVNAGQSCVAPDYILVPKDFQDKFIEALKATCVPLICQMNFA